MLRKAIDEAITKPGQRYLRYLGLDAIFGASRTKEILSVNPTVAPVREEAREVKIHVFDYDAVVDEYSRLRCFDFTGATVSVGSMWTGCARPMWKPFAAITRCTLC
ncbi:MAG: hypothetical protein QM664_04875 [Flavihumibacter sp.]